MLTAATTIRDLRMKFTDIKLKNGPTEAVNYLSSNASRGPDHSFFP